VFSPGMAPKRLLCLVLILVVSLYNLVSTNIAVNTFQLNQISDASYGDELSTTEAWDKLGCISECSKDATCKSATYDDVNNICKTNLRTTDATNICNVVSGCSTPNAILYAEKQFEVSVCFFQLINIMGEELYRTVEEHATTSFQFSYACWQKR